MSATTKTLALLDLFGPSSPTLSLADVTRLSGLAKPTAHRMMKELVELGFAEQFGPERKFRLGPKLVVLAKRREEMLPFRAIVEEAVAALSAQTGETVHASLLCGNVLQSLCNTQSQKHAMCVQISGDEALSFNGTSSGQAILAFSPPELVNQALASPLKRHTEKTITNPDALKTQLEDIQRTGVAISNGGYEADVHSHSAPIFGDQGFAIASISIAAPAVRVTPDTSQNFARLVRRAAGSVTQQTGGQLPPQLQDLPQ